MRQEKTPKTQAKQMELQRKQKLKTIKRLLSLKQMIYSSLMPVSGTVGSIYNEL